MDLSIDGLSKLRGIGPMILSLGFHPVTMSASREWLMAGIYSISLLIYYTIYTICPFGTENYESKK